MDKRRFRTLIRGDHKLSQNDFVQGKIVGYMDAFCSEYDGIEFAIRNNRETGEAILTVETSPGAYSVFQSFVEDRYPGLCEFDYGHWGH